MRILGLVTARGGSKGFPGKNLAELGGIPLVQRSHALLASFRQMHPETRLFLSTDSPAIAAAWPEADRPTRFRPAHLSDDQSTSLDVVRFELEAADREGFVAEGVLLVQPTSPLLELEDLESAWRCMEQGAPCAVGMVELDHPIQWVWNRGADGCLYQTFGQSEATRRQDLFSVYRPVGFYFSRREFLLQHGSFFVDGATQCVPVPAERGIDIDHPRDLWMAEGILRHLSGKEHQ